MIKSEYLYTGEASLEGYIFKDEDHARIESAVVMDTEINTVSLAIVTENTDTELSVKWDDPTSPGRLKITSNKDVMKKLRTNKILRLFTEDGEEVIIEL